MVERLARRIETLEAHVAHQDATIEDLNATMTAQWRRIDMLVRAVAALSDRLQDAGAREPGPPDPPPPHY